MLKHRFMHPLVAVLLLVSLLLQGTMVLAGTTGSLTGTLLDATSSTALGNAKVTITSPSQSVSTTTDAGGHFTFASLAPDTYSLSAEKQGYDPVTQAGINVLADQSQTVQLTTHKSLREIGRVTSRSTTDLVKPGTTADVYSVNALQQDKFSSVGGGGGLNNAYSAIATIPGAYVPLNQVGYFQTIHIRGGDYDQVGYELDGVPVNRSFDNYPSGTASSLGQQELQVYTGAAPANAEGQGLSGFINQVIRTGTFPGFANFTVAAGTPTFYHKTSFEIGGATPNRNFSYYLGVGGYNQTFRYVDQFNGSGLTPYGIPISLADCAGPTDITSSSCYANGAGTLGSIGPGGVNLAPINNTLVSYLGTRDTVANVHFGIPHHGDGSKDDVQLLYVNNHIYTQYFGSPTDIGAAAFGSGGTPTFTDGFTYTGPIAAPLPANAASLIKTYFFPSTPQDRLAGATIAGDLRDSYRNDQSIFKIQYQKNFSSNAYFRLYGYTYYSDWLQNGPNAAFSQGGPSPDYELSSHTRGLSGTFADQINAQNLVQLQGSFTTATSVRDNNSSMSDGGGRRSRFAVLVDANNPTSGLCYHTAAGVATPAVCDAAAPAGSRADYLTYAGVAGGASTTPGAATCGTGACEYYVVENGAYATYNSVKPAFTAFSLTDNFKPNDKLLINLGLRYDLFAFTGSDTTGTPARTLFFNGFNQDNCVSDTTGLVTDKITLGGAITSPCPAGYSATALSNAASGTVSYPVFQPRLGFTYTLNPDTVVRASYGRYAQAPNTAFEQYNTLEQNLPRLLGSSFYQYGFRSPAHHTKPEVSNNYDVSLEHHFRGTDLSFKLTPFYRYTQDQIQTFYLDQASGFVSGLNADRLTSRGVEFQLNKGDFGRDGLAAQLSFTYTNAYAQYNSLPQGLNFFSQINKDIATYNGYTKACAAAGNTVCPGAGAAASANAVPCFATDGTPDAACGAGSVANPYYNAPAQGLVDPNGKYQPFSLVTDQIGSAADSYLTPYVATLILQYKKNKLAFTPSLQFAAGQRYGVPETTPGIDPAGGCGALVTAPDAARYPYGAGLGTGGTTGLGYDAVSCAATLAAIPNPFTKRFDGIGDFVNPSALIANLQISYAASKNFTLVGTFANLINNCFGGSQQAWTTGGSNTCSYQTVGYAGNLTPVGNVYNPGSVIQPAVQYPYLRTYGQFNTDSPGASTKQPFSFFLEGRFKI